jgi:hypothetical protein
MQAREAEVGNLRQQLAERELLVETNQKLDRELKHGMS